MIRARSVSGGRWRFSVSSIQKVKLSRMMRWIELLKFCLIITAALLLAACSSLPQNTLMPLGETITPTIVETATPSSLPEAATQAITPSVSVDQITNADCNQGVVVFSAIGDGSSHTDKSGVYLACAEGTAVRQIIRDSDLLQSDDWRIID